MNIQSFLASRLPAFSVVGSILRQLYIVKAFQVYKYLGIHDVLPISFIFILDIGGFWHKIGCMNWGSVYTYVGIHTLLPSTLTRTTVVCSKCEQISSPESVGQLHSFCSLGVISWEYLDRSINSSLANFCLQLPVSGPSGPSTSLLSIYFLIFQNLTTMQFSPCFMFNLSVLMSTVQVQT